MITDRTRVYCSTVVQRLQTKLTAHQLAPTRAGHVVLFCREVLEMCREFINAHSTLQRLEVTVSPADMYRFLAILMYSHCTGFCFEFCINQLRQLGCHVPSLDRVRFICGNILAYSPTNRGDLGHDSWNCQRDQTPLLERFEKTAFRMSSRIFFVADYSMLTLDDDLYGTRAADNQVKKLSARKADKEGHCAIAVADALYRSTVGVRFMRRGESQDTCVDKVIRYVFEEQGQVNINGVIMAADRGFGKTAAIRKLASLGINIIFIFPEHLLRCHPFVGESILSPGSRESDDEDSDSSDGGGSCDDDVDAERSGDEDVDAEHAAEPSRRNRYNSVLDVSVVIILTSLCRFDRRRDFVIDDQPEMGSAAFIATKSMKIAGNRAGNRVRVTALAIRERGTEKQAKIIRFGYLLPPHLERKVNCWIAVPHPRRRDQSALFATIGEDGKLAEPVGVDPRSRIESWVLAKCTVLTLGQRCADWFCLRMFRITGTIASTILLSSPDLRAMIGIQGSGPAAATATSLFEKLMASWFSSARSSESMMRGTANEGAIFLLWRRSPSFWVSSILGCWQSNRSHGSRVLRMVLLGFVWMMKQSWQVSNLRVALVSPQEIVS